MNFWQKIKKEKNGPLMVLAPMADVTDPAFRRMIATYSRPDAIWTEFVSADGLFKGGYDALINDLRFSEIERPVIVQFFTSDPVMMEKAARLALELGFDGIDINMGCPAKKVCNVAAGSALLRDEPLVKTILEAVVNAVGIGPDAVPVTLKIRTGWDRENKNALEIARIAEQSGISMLTVHGRTRADLYHGEAEYDTIQAVKNSVKIPVVANGDIDTPEKAKYVLKTTGADAIMIGRAAQGRPWIFREINHYLNTGEKLPIPEINEIQSIMNAHLLDHYEFYGEHIGLRTARKHIGWYCKGLRDSHAFRQRMNTADDCKTQLQMVNDYFDEMKSHSDRLLFLEAA